jgi:hypothetical protein
LIENLLQMGSTGQIKFSGQRYPTAKGLRANLHPEH